MVETKGQMQQRHKREQKALRAEVEAMFRKVPKKDKAGRSELNVKVSEMEASLQTRHQAELLALETGVVVDTTAIPTSASSEDQESAEEAAATSATATAATTGETSEEKPPAAASTSNTASDAFTLGGMAYEVRGGGAGGAGGAKSRKAKRLAKKKQEERARQERVASERAAMGTTPKEREMNTLRRILGECGLKLHLVPSDGDCLYSSVLHQLKLLAESNSKAPTESDLASLRKRVCEYMLSHEDQFAPFVEVTTESAVLSSAAYRERCESVLRPGEWGGQLEVQALSESLQVPITVYSADAPPLRVGEGLDSSCALHLAYHRFYCALGEHYNS
eukprot:CAMPEP_0174234068 /NCGR_PEP_ID=MMETSP0417-20130205/3931_1 /TAXON_ID=242541 /ORGANISM="Mayorella sp, Strain BSH-02190019" /LENGTH=334 /DNA_ID=CAMNT_0015312375 /DNA_START=44 /DNA_END=1045 /DNA_ORIENTATION=-